MNMGRDGGQELHSRNRAERIGGVVGTYSNSTIHVLPLESDVVCRTTRLT